AAAAATMGYEPPETDKAAAVCCSAWFGPRLQSCAPGEYSRFSHHAGHAPRGVGGRSDQRRVAGEELPITPIHREEADGDGALQMRGPLRDRLQHAALQPLLPIRRLPVEAVQPIPVVVTPVGIV